MTSKIFFILWVLFAIPCAAVMSGEDASVGVSLFGGILVGGLLACLCLAVYGLFYRVFIYPFKKQPVKNTVLEARLSHLGPSPKKKKANWMLRSIGFLMLTPIILCFLSIIFDDEIHEMNGQRKASHISVLSVKEPPRVGESLRELEVDKLLHYKELYGVHQFVTLYKDNQYDHRFLINSYSAFNSRDEALEDFVLFGYDEEKKRIYGFQLNIFNSQVGKQLSLEKVVKLSGRYLPNFVLNGASKAEIYKDRDTYCYQTLTGFTWSITKRKENKWIIRGANHPGPCAKTKYAEPWTMNFEDLFNRSNDDLFE